MIGLMMINHISRYGFTDIRDVASSTMTWQCFFVSFSLFHCLFKVNWVMLPYWVLPRGNFHTWVIPCSCMGCGSLSSIRYYTYPHTASLLPLCGYRLLNFILDLTYCYLAEVTCLLSVFCSLVCLLPYLHKCLIIIIKVTVYRLQIDAYS